MSQPRPPPLNANTSYQTHQGSGFVTSYHQILRPILNVVHPSDNSPVQHSNLGPNFQGVPSGPRSDRNRSHGNQVGPHMYGPSRPYNRHPNSYQYQHSYHSYQQPQYNQQDTWRQPTVSLPIPNLQASSSNAGSNYSALYDTDGSSNIRKARESRVTNRQGGPLESGKGIRGRKFSYALIGNEAEHYITEDLRDQLASAIAPISGDPSAPSPMSSTKLAPRMIVDEFKRAGHLDTTRKELLSQFQSSEHKDYLLQTLQVFLLQRIKDMTPEKRQKLASQSERLQQSELSGWFENSAEAADMIDDVLKRLRGQEGDESSLFASRGAIGGTLEARLYEVIQTEKSRIEHLKVDTSDEEGNSTPLNKASGGSQTPVTT